jgi:hypothetical protein
MRQKIPVLVVAALLCLAASAGPRVTAGTALAQSGNGYDLSWWTVDGGGGAMTGSAWSRTYTLIGTSGQPDAGTLAKDPYLLDGGFWGRGESVEAGHHVYLPLVLRVQP